MMMMMMMIICDVLFLFGILGKGLIQLEETQGGTDTTHGVLAQERFTEPDFVHDPGSRYCMR